jgi:hypothetical protein
MTVFRTLVLLVILTAAVTVGAFAWIARVPLSQTVNSEPKQALFEITGDRTVSQSMRPATDGLRGIDVVFGTFARSNSAILEMSLVRTEEPRSPLVQRQIRTAELADNEPYRLRFPPIDDSAGTEFVLTLTSPDGVPGNAVTVWFLPADAYPQGSLITDGTQQPGDLVLGLHFRPRVVDFLRANPSHLLKMRGPEDAWKLALLYAVALATAALAVGMMVRVVRREGGDNPRDFPVSLALAAGLFLIMSLWVSSGRF